MRINAVRVARQTDRLEEVVAFYRDVVGLPVIGGFRDHDGYSGVMLGVTGEVTHLEFTERAGGSPGRAGGADDLLVLYCEAVDVGAALERAAAADLRPEAPANPYWDSVAAAILADPDGRRVVLVPTPPRA